MKLNKGLQRFTKANPKFRALLQLDQITQVDIESLTEREQKAFSACVNKIYSELKDEELDEFIRKVEPIMINETRHRIWEHNHNQLTWAISTLMQEYGRMPTQSELASKTGLSRQTIQKHLNEYHKHPLYLRQQEQFKFLADKVLARVFKFAVNGDIGAAKLYFNVLGYLNHNKPTGNTTIKNQNNYIQINGLTLSQEKINHLDPDQLALIEGILKEAMPQSE